MPAIRIVGVKQIQANRIVEQVKVLLAMKSYDLILIPRATQWKERTESGLGLQIIF